MFEFEIFRGGAKTKCCVCLCVGQTDRYTKLLVFEPHSSLGHRKMTIKKQVSLAFRYISNKSMDA